MVFEWNFKRVSKVFKRNSFGVFGKFQRCFKEILRVFQGRLRGVSRVSKRSSKSVQREFGGIFKDVLRKFKGSFSMSQENLKEKLQCFNEVLFYKVVVAWNSSELPEQKEGLFFFTSSLTKAR